ncbi:hypothetical protein HNQ80_000321 [Anaerosolibacter carboniphilus]|uniref:Na+/glutamate symporter n=1 Tax=Anaerosolibacter carboniphilus TaxID=1417629 RepID=A0A841KTK0_9FIRM|nr:hypothetical protein [Anaerosolibacter carboniphilus]MBB6214252.1 hypothetical protein [Anaerosolibacter carboniphilus]
MSLMMAFCVVLGVLAIGDVVSTKTKAFIPSVFVAALLFLLGFWTFFPANIVELAGFSMPVILLSMYLLISHMGTMLSVKELAAQWRTIVIALAGIIGICLGTLTIGRMLFGWEMVVTATPPLTGGIVAAIMMSEAASAKGMTELAVLAIVMYVMQGFVGYPLTATMLRKEGTRLLSLYRDGKVSLVDQALEQAPVTILEEKSRFRIFPETPKKYQTTYVLLLKLGVVAWASVAFAGVIQDKISKYVICLIFGVIAAEIGFVERKPLNLSSSFGFLITGLMAYVFAGLAKATPEMLMQLVGPLVGIILLGVFGMAIFSIFIGKTLGYSKEMSFAVALTALYGFPPNYILTEEAAKALAETEEEQKYLMDEMLPKMLVGGFTTVTIVSVIIAGIFVKFL